MGVLSVCHQSRFSGKFGVSIFDICSRDFLACGINHNSYGKIEFPHYVYSLTFVPEIHRSISRSTVVSCAKFDRNEKGSFAILNLLSPIIYFCAGDNRRFVFISKFFDNTPKSLFYTGDTFERIRHKKWIMII